jgi:hypothetical protein
MKGRLLRILVALIVIVPLVLLATKIRFKETKIPVPLTGEALSNPFYAAIKLSEQLGAEARREYIFNTPRTDSVIVLSNWNWTLIDSRREKMQQWVEAGGRLVVDGSLLGDFEQFSAWSGVGESVPVEDEEESLEEDLSESQRRLLSGFVKSECDALVEEGTGREFKICNVDRSRSLVTARKKLWELRDGERIHVVRTAVGGGSVTVINAAPFRYRDLLEGDNALLLVRATQLRRGDSLLFLSEEEHNSILDLVWRHGAPAVLLMLALIALGLWRASARFGPLTAPIEAARRSLAEQIRGTGQFVLRFGGGRALHAAMVRALRDAALKHLPAYDRLSSEERVAAVARLSGVSAEELGPVLNYSGSRRSHELRNAIALLETARRRIMLKNKRPRNGN